MWVTESLFCSFIRGILHLFKGCFTAHPSPKPAPDGRRAALLEPLDGGELGVAGGPPGARGPLSGPGVGGDWGEMASFPWVCLEGCLPPREATASSEGDVMGPRPPALGTSCGGARVVKSSCHGRDLASRRRGPSLHSGLSCTKKERGLWARGQEPECCFWAGPSLRCSDGRRGGPELFGGSVSQAHCP